MQTVEQYCLNYWENVKKCTGECSQKLIPGFEVCDGKRFPDEISWYDTNVFIKQLEGRKNNAKKLNLFEEKDSILHDYRQYNYTLMSGEQVKYLVTDISLQDG